MKALLLGVLCLLLLTSNATAYGSYQGHQAEYFSYGTSYYYPMHYIGPARTGLTSPAYFYPNKYVNNVYSFYNYRAYTHQAYRFPYSIAAEPYTGPLNPHYYAAW